MVVRGQQEKGLKVRSKIIIRLSARGGQLEKGVWLESAAEWCVSQWSAGESCQSVGSGIEVSGSCE